MITRVIKAIRHNIVAWLALFVALTGTSMAASHYIITSTKQIKPSVLRELRGARGATGAKGAKGVTGAQGATGPQGSTGATGTAGSNGANGKSITGKEGPEGPEGSEGLEGKEGKEGKEGAPGTALAFAHIGANGEVIEASEKGKPAPNIKGTQAEEEGEIIEGVYCISGLGFEAHNVVGTIDYEETLPNQSPVLTATIGIGDDSECPQGTQITVETSEKQGEPKNEGFYIVIN